MVETEEDLAALFDADEFAVPALYRSPVPGAAAVLCSVIADLGQGRDVFSGGEQRAATAERHIWVSALALAQVQRDGIFEMLEPSALPEEQIVTERLRVSGLPKLDHIGHLWSVALMLVGD